MDNDSLILHLKAGRVSFLFTGDIQSEAELQLIARRAAPNSTVLKVAHHGSDTSTAGEFLSSVNPQIAVISVGAENRFGHPSPDVLTRLEQQLGADNIYRTYHQGTITFITDGEKLWVSATK
jgi:competence protein ComEC